MLGSPATARLSPRVAGALNLVLDSPTFRFWLRRSSASEHHYALRFEVFDGHGVLRVARPGVLIDPPARESGYEGELTLTQVRSSRFLHITGVDRRRQLYFLSRIPDDATAFSEEGWVELRATVDRGAHHLMLERDVDAPPPPAATVEQDTVPMAPARAAETLPSLPPSALQPLSDDESIWAREPSETRGGPAAPDPAETTPPTSLLRYLRRQLSEVRRENAVLQARVTWLERRLAAADSPIAMDADTADDVSEEL